MFESISSKARRRLVFAGMMSCLFAAGLAFAAFENGSVSKPVSPAGIPQIETSATALDPRNNPDDCLYEPPTSKAMAAVQNGPGESGSSTAANSTAKPGDDDAAPAGKPGSPSDDTSRSPSTDGACELPDDDETSKDPHKSDTESACPGL